MDKNFDYSCFDKQYDSAKVKEAINDYEKNGGDGDFEPVPHDTYEVKVNSCELKKSKKGDPMVSIVFKIINGTFKNRLIFMNQVVKEAFQFHIVNALLKSLDTGLDIHFDTYQQYGNMLYDVAEQTESQNLEYQLNYEEAKNDFDKFTIEQVFESEAPMQVAPSDDDDEEPPF